ncbi:MAG: GNAT family N-acetyltransferase [Gammaproteobacteria bacterium]
MTVKLTFLADQVDAIPIIAQWYLDEWGYLIPDETLDRARVRLQDYLNRDRIPFVLVAIRDDEVIGCAQLKFREMGKLFPDKEHWIGGVYVASRHRGDGVGSLLAETICSRAPDYGVQTVHLQTKRLDGGLYARLGWLPVQQVENHGLQVLVMERHLRP